MVLKKQFKVNKGVEEVAEIINSLLTKQQRSALEIVLNGKKFNFKERLIVLYRKMKPKYSRLETRFQVASIIKANQDTLDKSAENGDKNIEMIEAFAKKFEPLFIKKYEHLYKLVCWLWTNREQIFNLIKGFISAKPKVI